MIYAINYNDKELSGRITLKGTRSKILMEYRLLTRAIWDQFGSGQIIAWGAGLANDDMRKVTIDLDIQPDQGGEYIPEEVTNYERL